MSVTKIFTVKKASHFLVLKRVSSANTIETVWLGIKKSEVSEQYSLPRVISEFGIVILKMGTLFGAIKHETLVLVCLAKMTIIFVCT